MNIIESHKQEFENIVEFFKKDIQGIRTNRATPDLVSHVLVSVYGAKTPLEQLASVNVPEPRTIVIQPWDKSIIKEIEKALSSVDLGASPLSQEGIIRLVLPALSEETRNNLVKILKTKLEHSHQSLRTIRDLVREKIIKSERAKEMSEDDKFRLLEDLDKFTVAKQEEMKLICERKEKEITSI
ncbi:MAG: ribosome recycling factor [Patescibacteria group bacterium]|jgi:ribosome recycling factor|nr:ribosome recycling factor [Patescibacteria group bacterium]